ncbi:hypothetical protein [Carboxylicivirga sp. M1479]|uniref:hypothetical protein n=1 Tax=Carboxylicivirga sp. M1479 TaxID=2594476 RepID=UPI00117854E0|nr:hypothetical protein [Carboxylicivirga sp. M1479]TRX66009.1 hypothetical protein FNN09_15520 [Carboxylicivirga sp. M1479]
MTNNENTRNERMWFIKRTIIISSLLILNVVGIYLYYYVLVFNSIETGKVYGESTFNGGRYEIYTLKYFYQHKDVYYFDKIDYVMAQDLQLGDSIKVRVLKPYPQKHMVHKVYRDDSKTINYDAKDGFMVEYNAYIEQFSDYEASKHIQHITPRKNTLLIKQNEETHVQNAVERAIDNIHFNRGSIVDYYIVNTSNDSLYIRAVYHYLNDFSTDAMPFKMIQKQLKRSLPNKHLHISVLDKSNAKKEHILIAE